MLTAGFLTAFVGVAALYWVVGALYVATSREIKRFDVSDSTEVSLSRSERHTITHIHQLLRSPRWHVDDPLLRRQRALYAEALPRARPEHVSVPADIQLTFL